MNKALVIIDVQNDYFPGGRKELKDSLEALENIQKVIKNCREKGCKIIFIKHIAIKPTATFFINGTSGVEIHKGIEPEENDEIIIKNYPNSFRETDLKEVLNRNQITDLVFTGMMTHMCVDTTVRAAFDLGYSSILISDCCATLDLTYENEMIKAKEVQNVFLAALNGTFCKIMITDDFIEQKK